MEKPFIPLANDQKEKEIRDKLNLIKQHETIIKPKDLKDVLGKEAYDKVLNDVDSFLSDIEIVDTDNLQTAKEIGIPVINYEDDVNTSVHYYAQPSNKLTIIENGKNLYGCYDDIASCSEDISSSASLKQEILDSANRLHFSSEALIKVLKDMIAELESYK